jgi:hypothetical protein
MVDYLVDHAQHNVWCTPHQDYQSIVKPRRLSAPGGVWNYIDLMGRRFTLPQQSVRFHVYMVGQLHPLLMGLLPQQYKWVAFSDACNAEKLIVDLYSAKGIQLPRFESYYLITPDKNLIVAVKKQATIPFDLEVEDLFLRVYRNSYFNTDRAGASHADYIQVTGQRVLNQAAILQMQKDYKALAALPGCVSAFVNGYRVSGIDPFTATIGDVVEYVYDSSVYQTLDFELGALPTFTSTLDAKYKYLLHYAGAGDGTIDYEDDIDVFVYLKDQFGRFKGVYFPRNAGDALRNVTHKDYSLPTAYLAALATANGWDVDNLTIRLQVRLGGWGIRKLVFDANRIFELYKLPDADVQQALLGVNSTVPYWRADTLEASAYTAIMRADSPVFPLQLVEDAYGYNAISKLLGDTPAQAERVGGRLQVAIPYGLQNNCTGYEYDAQGWLLGHYAAGLGPVYYATNPDCAMVELISGQGSQRLDEVYGQATSLIDPKANYRFYTCPIGDDGKPTNVWTDVTGSGQYAVQNGKVTWLIDLNKFDTCVRSDNTFLAYQMALKPADGLLQFTLVTQVVRNYLVQNQQMQIPMGELDLSLNGHALVEDIDYIVQFPQVLITNKAFLEDVENQTQVVDVRMTGFCNPDFSRTERWDYGFVMYDQLSNNSKFDLRDDKVLRIQVGGNVVTREAFTFAEDSPAVTVPNGNNGKPYEVRDIVVPVRGNTVSDTYTLRAKSLVVDEVVSDYLTMKLPEQEPETPNVIAQQWTVYSPFFTKLMWDLINGVLTDARLTAQYSDQDVVAICKPYEKWLAFDQTQDENLIDANYLLVTPHNLERTVTVDAYVYKFLSRVVRLYLHNRVNMSRWLRIATF